MRRTVILLVAALAAAGAVLPPTQVVQPTRPAPPEAARVPAPSLSLLAPLDVLEALWQKRKVRRMLDAMGIQPTHVPLRVKLRWYWRNAGAWGTFAVLPLLALGLPVLPGNALQPPKNDVYAGGNWHREAVVVQMKVKTAANIRSGRALIRDTNDNEVQVAGAAAVNMLGWCTQRNWTQPDWDHTTAPAANDLIDVLLALPGVIGMVRNAANLTQGDQAILKANGELDAFPGMPAAGDSRKIVGRLLRSSDGSGGAVDSLVVVK